jgi:hypothetical protein
MCALNTLLFTLMCLIFVLLFLIQSSTNMHNFLPLKEQNETVFGGSQTVLVFYGVRMKNFTLLYGHFEKVFN